MGYFKTNKYRNKSIVSGGIVYDSKAEARRGAELELLQAAGEITKLKRQVKFVLIPAQYEQSTELYKRGVRKGQPKPGKLIEREVTYIADFVYINAHGERVVEDVKGYKDGEAYKLFTIKRKLMLYINGIRVAEIRGGNK